MKKLLLVLVVVTMASLLLVGCLTTPQEDEVVTIAAIPGVTAPVTGATPVTTITATAQYTGVVTWLPVATTFAAATAYTATITLTPVTGFTLTGVAVDFFTVAGATATNLVDSGVVTAVFPATAAAPVVNVAPEITSIAVLTATVGEVYTYTVVATDANAGDVLTYSLTAGPAGMNINSTTGLINWTPILAGSYVVSVMVSDGALTDTQDFTVVASDPVVPVLTATIWYNPTHSYVGDYTYVRGYAVPADKVPVEVTLSEALATGEYLQIQWNDGIKNGGWEALTLKTGSTLVYAGTVTFDAEALSPVCKLVCVEVAKFDADYCPACDPIIILQDTVKVDGVDPELDLKITFKDCIDACNPGAYFIFAPDTYGTCPPLDCCGDACSGIDSWTIEDATACPECATLTGINCVAGTYLCGCLLYADGYNDHTGDPQAEETIIYKLKFTFADNVGNAIVDTWVITVDTDSVVTFANNKGTPAETNKDAKFTVGTGIAVIDYTDCTPAE